MEKLTDGIKTLLLAGVGAVALTADKSQELLKELVSRGELTVEQGKALNRPAPAPAKPAPKPAPKPMPKRPTRSTLSRIFQRTNLTN